MAAIFTLTVRQLAGSRRIWLVLALVSLPLLAARPVPRRRLDDDDRASSPTTSRRRWSPPAILPLVMLLFATSAFGNEVGDRTLGYLVLKPLARWRIVLPKLRRGDRRRRHPGRR